MFKSYKMNPSWEKLITWYRHLFIGLQYKFLFHSLEKHAAVCAYMYIDSHVQVKSFYIEFSFPEHILFDRK